MRIRHLKPWLVGTALITVLSVGTISLTTAHLYEVVSVVNTTNKAVVTNRIDENFNGTEKTNVCVENTGNVMAYVRVAVIPIWRDTDGSATTLSTDNTYNIVLNMTDWFQGDDGYYYCRKAIAPSEKTPDLIKSCTLKTLTDQSYNHKNFDLQVLAQSIQADPSTAVKSAWHISVNADGSLTP